MLGGEPEATGSGCVVSGLQPRVHDLCTDLHDLADLAKSAEISRFALCANLAISADFARSAI
eukprot:NODE_8004_length_538_cov_3.826176_g6957_i0.p4 GENE.NODE_8004_length_538_cov_3.826176_g6957_i0~~NODE_8004_length_538_cov_3.826176_g6957_i0.p4  ORF type:complete len:62 (-),score=5.79 NODE_8004_length_538_cov_3.826176_g6957_i0:165-350(-)